MQVRYGPISAIELERSAQLLNKTNQFNTTGRRYAVEELTRLASDALNMALQFRLVDRLGDNGLVSVMILQPGAAGAGEMDIDIWVMSCRVFGRQLEHEVMNIAVELARECGTRALTARFVPTERNGVIKRLFADLGFLPATGHGAAGAQSWRLDLAAYAPHTTHLQRASARS